MLFRGPNARKTSSIRQIPPLGDPYIPSLLGMYLIVTIGERDCPQLCGKPNAGYKLFHTQYMGAYGEQIWGPPDVPKGAHVYIMFPFEPG